ncbi:3-ketoacyl-acyl carrier protein reductase [Diaporthe amygdali]|uniref:3-ketoacyl-acyl carrier protein reductase n=1 Tax=Phomopsis amygdali TaxID=1214568 RepID=UPI0022FE94E0|nr:3-ketoacyl-acyl carrier protein reductase [Diaporthe amygdali]KAJ0123598.1 3-ketoacyl-acyl carrier protein reductase [Diaporthe amygdali]
MSTHTVIVTGAGGGLGKAIAAAFLAAGSNVAICDVNQERLTATEQEWVAAGHKAERILTTTTDVSDQAAVQALVDGSVARFGRLDLLVNNAGIMDDFSPAGECPPELWARVLGVNLNGPYYATRAAVAQFQKQGDGKGGLIINICSVAAKSGHSAGAAYTASKHGLLGLSKNTAFAYADKGIYSVAFLLGGMNTHITDAMAKGINMDFFQKFEQAQAKFDAEKHSVPVENVAKYCVFLSDRGIAKSANGACLDFTNNWPAQ